MRDIALKTLRSASNKDISQTGVEPGHLFPIALKTLRSALHKDISQTGFEPGHPCLIMRDIALNYRDGGLGFLAHPIYFWFIT